MGLTPNTTRSQRPLGEARAALSERLRGRRHEIEAAIAARTFAPPDSSQETADPDYLEGMRAAVTAAVGYGLLAIERGEERTPAPPPTLLTQACMAARNGVGLDTVLRRYLAGYSLLSEFVIEEAEDGGLVHEPPFKHLLRGQAAVFDRLIAAVSAEYNREADRSSSTTSQRRGERVKRLLAGELIDTSELAYEFDVCHLAAIASGPGAPGEMRKLASILDHQLLIIPAGEEAVWAWLGSRREVEPANLERHAHAILPPNVVLALGEPARGLAGWRLTHQQARAAFSIARRTAQRLVRYADIALLAAMLQNNLLTISLRKLYLMPLEAERDGGETLRETLHAYFAAERNGSSAAAMLGVSRQTVAKRLALIENLLGRRLGSCGLELEAALRLEQVDHSDGASSFGQEVL